MYFDRLGPLQSRSWYRNCTTLCACNHFLAGPSFFLFFKFNAPFNETSNTTNTAAFSANIRQPSTKILIQRKSHRLIRKVPTFFQWLHLNHSLAHGKEKNTFPDPAQPGKKCSLHVHQNPLSKLQIRKLITWLHKVYEKKKPLGPFLSFGIIAHTKKS